VCASDPLGQVPVFVISLKYFSSTPKVCKRKYARTEQYEFLSDLLGEVSLWQVENFFFSTPKVCKWKFCKGSTYCVLKWWSGKRVFVTNFPLLLTRMNGIMQGQYGTYSQVIFWEKCLLKIFFLHSQSVWMELCRGSTVRVPRWSSGRSVFVSCWEYFSSTPKVCKGIFSKAEQD